MKAVLAATAHKPLEFLEARQLVQMSEVDSALRDEARSDHLWLIQLQNYFPTTYGLSSLPSHLARNRCRATHGRDEESTELVPVRAHGERRDRWSFHPADEGAAVQGLVLSDCWTCEGRYYRRKNGNGAAPPSSVRFNAATGALEDLFHPGHEPAEFTPPSQFSGPRRTKIWVERPLPYRCAACEVVCHSGESYREHCKTWDHIERLLEPHLRMPLEFVDPRDLATYSQLSMLDRFKALVPWERKVLMQIRDSAEADTESMQTWVDWALRWVYVKEEEGWLEENFPDEDPDDIRARCTLEVATEACISYAQGDFEEFGLKRGVAREVLVGGWGMAEIVGGSASGGIMMSLLTGLDL